MPVSKYNLFYVHISDITPQLPSKPCKSYPYSHRPVSDKAKSRKLLILQVLPGFFIISGASEGKTPYSKFDRFRFLSLYSFRRTFRLSLRVSALFRLASNVPCGDVALQDFIRKPKELNRTEFGAALPAVDLRGRDRVLFPVAAVIAVV